MCAMMEKLRMNAGSMRYDAVGARHVRPFELSHMSYSNIRFEADEHGVALVSVNRPDKLNALNRDTMGELADAFSRVRDDAGIHGLIVTGAGEKAFVAGADIKELAVLSPLEAQALSQRGQTIFRTLETMPKPSV